ncbi:alpha/beta fold hydrolase [Amycolatopsis sacchari]|uniref:alpha/beta fold hydrolase n=1 Tax=Amycolatopsis sacchari TaxID=115433 RepID=UPI003D761271
MIARSWHPESTVVGGTPMHSGTLGRGPSVVCVPGLGCSHRYFLPLARRLAPHAHISAPDLPGFGASPGPAEALDVRGLSLALAGWLRATRRGGSVLVANSAGCQVVADLAVHSPGLLGPVVFIGPTTDPHLRAWPRQALGLLADVPREHPALAPVVGLDYLKCGPRRFLATFRHVLRDPWEDKLPAVHTPTVVVRGTRDPLVSGKWAREATALLPAGRLVELPGKPHALNFSAPAETARIVLGLLAPRSSG